MAAERKPIKTETGLIPAAPGRSRETRFSFFRSASVEVWAIGEGSCDGKVAFFTAFFTLWRSDFPQPGQENMKFLGSFNNWRVCFLAGLRVARFEEDLQK